MTVNSVNTNAAALLAMSHKRGNEQRGDAIAKQVQTGYRVADASDDAAVFAVAQGVRSDLKQSQSIRIAIANAIGSIEVGLSGATTFSDQLYDLKAIAIHASDDSLTPEQSQLYANDFRAKLTEMRQVLEQAAFGGRNLLIEFAVPFNTAIGTVQSYDIPVDTTGNMVTVSGHRLDYVWANLDLESADTPADARAAIAAIDTYVPDVNTALAQLGADKNYFERQLLFVQEKEAAMLKGVGALVDADIGAAEAERQSLLVQRDLITEGLSIANKRPRNLLDLFS